MDIEAIQKNIEEIEKEIKFYLEKYPFYRRIIILGLTGSGKSTLACSLAQKELIIEKEGEKFVRIKGEGVVAGCKAGTEKPAIYVDEANRLLLCDCPGFEDVDGCINEIRNAFADDYILYSSNNNGIMVKILLVISSSEFIARRGKAVKNTIMRMQRMFPNPFELKNGIGIVVSKGDPDIQGRYYFNLLLEKIDEFLKKWYDYFIACDDQIFTFPHPLPADIGKQYQFDDNDRLISFITNENDFLDNPSHKIAVRDEVITHLKVIKEHNLSEMTNIIKDIFLLMNEQYLKSENSTTLKIWLKNMHLLLDPKIKKIADFHNKINQIVQNNQQFDEQFEKLSHIEVFDSFVDRIDGMNTMDSYLQQILILLTKSAIQEIEKLVSISENSEM